MASNQQNNPSGAIPVYPAPAGGGSTSTALNVTTTRVLKQAPGAVLRVNVIVAGSAPGGVYDAVTGTAVTASTQAAVIPNAVGPVEIEFPCLVGIVVVPGSGQTVAVSYQ